MLKWLWLSGFVIAADQMTKYLASTLLTYHVPVPVLPFFNWFLVHNTGAAFSFLSDAAGWQRWFFIALAGLVSVGIVLWMRRLTAPERWLAVALSLILGGAMGNMIDRIAFGYVVDFVQLYYRNWYWPAFNVADSAISIGVAVLIIDALWGSGRVRGDRNTVI